MSFLNLLRKGFEKTFNVWEIIKDDKHLMNDCLSGGGNNMWTILLVMQLNQRSLKEVLFDIQTCVTKELQKVRLDGWNSIMKMA